MRRLLLPFFFFSAVCAAAQWQHTAAMQYNEWLGVTANSFIKNGAYIFAATNSDVYRSSDNGLDWYTADSGIPSGTSLQTFVMIDSAMFVGGATGLYISTDYGNYWKPLLQHGYPLATDGTNLYQWGGRGLGLFISSDKGKDWDSISNGRANNPNIFSLVSKDTTIFAGTYSGVVSTTNKGKTWVSIDSGLTISYIFSLEAEGADLYAAGLGGVSLSTNSGVNWRSLGLVNSNINSLTVHDSYIFATVGDTIFRSIDNGGHWISETGSWDSITSPPVYLADTVVVFGTNTSGAFESTDNGAHWLPWVLTNPAVYSVATLDTNIAAGTNVGIFFSSDKGKNWQQTLSFPYYLAYITLKVHDGIIYAGVSTGNVYTSSDDGASWSYKGNVFWYGTINDFAFKDSSVFVATYGNGIERATDWFSWHVTKQPTGVYINSLVVKGSFLFAGTHEGFFSTTNDGESWNTLDLGLTSTTILRLAVIGSELFAGTDSGGVFVSTDNGEQWTSANTGITNDTIEDFAVVGKNLFAGTMGGGVFLTTNYGSTWTPENAGLGDEAVYSLATSDSNLYAATGYTGVWRRPLADFGITGVDEKQTVLPATLTLEQNYPNPFSSVANISFRVNESDLYGKEVTVKIYDIKGNEVATVYQGTADAQSHTVQINGSDIPSGEYYCYLQCDGWDLRKQMTVVR